MFGGVRWLLGTQREMEGVEVRVVDVRSVLHNVAGGIVSRALHSEERGTNLGLKKPRILLGGIAGTN